MPLLSINRHIAHLGAKHEKVMKAAQKEVSPQPEVFWDEFETLSQRMFLTQYCQERIYMLHHYDMKSMIIPKELTHVESQKESV